MSDSSRLTPSPRKSTAASTPAATPPRVPSHALLGGGREVVIEHGAREYRLRLTQSGKLILTA